MEYLLGLLAGGFLLFNSSVTPGKVADKAQTALHQLYPQAQVAVQVEGKRGRDVLRGRFKRVRVNMTHVGNIEKPASQPASENKPASDFTLETVTQTKNEGRIGRLEVEMRDFQAQGVSIEAARLESDDLRFDWKAVKKGTGIRVVGAQRTWAWVRIDASGVARLVAARLSGTRDVRVTLDNGMAHISGRRAFLGMGEVPFTLDARVVGERNVLRLRDTQLKVAGATLPSLVADPLLSRLDPVYTLDPRGEWPVAISLRNVRVERDGLELEADLQWKTPTS